MRFALGRAGKRASFILALAIDVSVSACSRLVSEAAPGPTAPIRPAQSAAPAAYAMDVPEPLEASCAAGGAKDCLREALRVAAHEDGSLSLLSRGCKLGDRAACSLHEAMSTRFHPLTFPLWQHPDLTSMACAHGAPSACKELFERFGPRAALFRFGNPPSDGGPRLATVQRLAKLTPAPGQPVFEAYAHPGAIVVVLSQQHEHALIVISGFPLARYDVALGDGTFESRQEPPRLALITRESLSDQVVEEHARGSLSGPAQSRELTLYDRPEGMPLYNTACEPATVLARDGDYLLLSQVVNGIEVRGWARDDDRRVPRRCGLAVSASTRAQYSLIGLAQPDYSTAARAAERLRSGSKVYWLEPGGDDGTECRQYQVRGNSLVGEWTPKINGGARSRTSYQWVRSGRFVWLGGPLISTRDGRLTTVRCMHDYEIVDEKDGAILLVDGSESDPLVAFEPRRAERWYPTREACEAVRASEVRVEASEGPSRAIFAGLSGVHSGC